ncbi:unnamed protein product [Caretta caretta]
MLPSPESAVAPYYATEKKENQCWRLNVFQQMVCMPFPGKTHDSRRGGAVLRPECFSLFQRWSLYQSSQLSDACFSQRSMVELENLWKTG